MAHLEFFPIKQLNMLKAHKQIPVTIECIYLQTILSQGHSIKDFQKLFGMYTHQIKGHFSTLHQSISHDDDDDSGGWSSLCNDKLCILTIVFKQFLDHQHHTKLHEFFSSKNLPIF